MPDIIKKCKICGKEFVITEGELQFYKDRGLQEPKRCEECRPAARKDEIALLKRRVEEIEKCLKLSN